MHHGPAERLLHRAAVSRGAPGSASATELVAYCCGSSGSGVTASIMACSSS